MALSKYKEAPIGQVFGKWRVKDYSHYDNEHYWLVECVCKTIAPRRAGQLVNNRSSSCRTCAAKDRESSKSPFWEGLGPISKQYLTRLKHRKKEVTITLKDLLTQWEKQEGRCVYTNVRLLLVSRDSGWKQSTASIDRIDSSKGYVKGNIQWVHKRINSMKNDLKEEEFIQWCRLVTQKGGSCGT